jgi:hypothetical protein
MHLGIVRRAAGQNGIAGEEYLMTREVAGNEDWKRKIINLSEIYMLQ